MQEFGRMIVADRPNRIVVVLSYKVFVRGVLVSHAEMSQLQNSGNSEMFHGEWLAWREKKAC
jgi:hypothetical protein